MFRTASPYHTQYASPKYSVGQAIGGLLGMIISKNTAEREQAKINTGLIDFNQSLASNTPSISTTTMDGQPMFQPDSPNLTTVLPASTALARRAN